MNSTASSLCDGILGECSGTIDGIVNNDLLLTNNNILTTKREKYDSKCSLLSIQQGTAFCAGKSDLLLHFVKAAGREEGQQFQPFISG